MRTSDRGLMALIRHEGVVPGPYLEVQGIWTFGIGHTAAAGLPDPALMPRGMPADLDVGIREAFRAFRADLARYEAEVAAGLPASQAAGSPSAQRNGPQALIPAAGRRWRGHVLQRDEVTVLLIEAPVRPVATGDAFDLSTAATSGWRPARLVDRT